MSFNSQRSNYEIKVTPTLHPIHESNNDNNSKPCFPIRYYIAFVSSITMAIMFAVRNCLTVAIVSMTYDEVTESINGSSLLTSLNGGNDSVVIKPLTEKVNIHQYW